MPETRFRSSRQEVAFSTNRNPVVSASGKGCTRTPRIRRVTNICKSTKLAVGSENKPPSVGSGCGSGRGGGGSVLPSWHRRVPLQDITNIMLEIERRRANRGEGETLRESPMLQNRANNLSKSTSPVQPKHDISMISPHPTIKTKVCPPTNIGKVPKILLNITKNQNDCDPSSPCLTPQKKLLENIYTVEKVVMEELFKLKRAPPAKKAEREKRVKSLMSMR